MGSRVWAAVGPAVVCIAASVAPAFGAEPAAAPFRLTEEPFRLTDEPLRLLVQSDYESVYAPPDPISANTGVNEGGVHVALDLSYMSDYVYRGINESNRIAAARACSSSPSIHSTAWRAWMAVVS